MSYQVNNRIFFVNENFLNEYNCWNKQDKKGYFIVGKTSLPLSTIGLNYQNIVIDKSKIIQIRNKHKELNDDLICKIPDILNKPILIIKSETVNMRIIIFSKLLDIYNNPIIVIMELNPYENQTIINKIYKVASIYGKNNIKVINKWLNNKENILYYDKKSNNWLKELGIIINNDNKSIMIKDIPNNERPRERAIKYGISSLSNEELLSIIIKTGTKNYSVKYLASKILSNLKSIENMRNLTISNLTMINGIGTVKAIEILSSLELGKRVYYEKEKMNVKLNNSKKIYEYFRYLFINEKQENFYAIYLDSKSNLISYRLLFKGTINTSCVHPREVFKYAFLESAYSIVVFHNHPSGDETPSQEDEKVTYSLMNIGKLVAIPVVDHIVFGNKNYFSFYEYISNNKNNI